jgi:hypothetical protein
MFTATYERQRRYERRKAAEAADVGGIPAVVNPERRAACRLDLLKFLTTYFPLSTGLKPFSDDHRRVIARIQQCVLEGGLFVQAVYRGFAKTTITENAAIWATLYGHRKFVPIFGADANAAKGNIESIKLELNENDLLAEDFPEVCHAIRELEWKPQRCASQTFTVPEQCGKCGGENSEKCGRCGATGVVGIPRLTHIEWTSDRIVFPTIPGSVASGAVICARGIMGGSRGMKHKEPGGNQQRPDFVLIDDPQTDESASTPLQVQKRLNTVRKSILKLGGHSRKIAVVMNATVIQADDMVEQLLDAKKFPSWQGERIKMVRKWAGGRPTNANAETWKGPDTHDRMWLGDYARIRNTYDPESLGDQQRAHREATAFYKRNRPKMDAGCEVSWGHCYDPSTEESAVQHAYNILIDDGEEVFASECQNEPLSRDVEGQQPTLTAGEIAEKVNGMGRGAVPLSASRVVAFIDVQKTALFWGVCGFGDGFIGNVLDYGIWPEQRRSYVALKEIRNTIQKVTKRASLEEAIYAGLDALTNELMGRDWKRDDGAVLKLERILPDANWGESTDVIYQFCRQSPHSAVLTPSHGMYVGAKSTRPFNAYRPKPGDRVGLNWRMPGVQGRRQVRYVLFDTNFWKSFVHKRLATAEGGRGALALFGDEPKDHQMFADHLTSEYPIEVEARGRKVVEWVLKPGRPDNHFLDCLVGCHVAASMQGVGLIEQTAQPARVRMKLSDLQKQKRRA